VKPILSHRKSHIKNSLQQYLNKRYLAILVLLITLFSALILFMRSIAMDDTTDYYMHYDAQVLSEYYQKTDGIAEFDQGRKEYYWGLNKLPERYRLLLKVNDAHTSLILNETQVFEMADKFVYILPYYSHDKEDIFFVLHLFDLQNEAMFYQSWQNVFVLLVTLLLLFVIFYSLHTNRHIIQQMDDFTGWVKSMSALSYDDLQRKNAPESLSFVELINSANYLQSSLLTQYDLQQKEQVILTREKHFLSSLSHELRTPMAITAAALSLLNKSEQIIPKDRDKLVKLHKAHMNMKQLTNTLLHLWRGQPHLSQGGSTHLYSHAEQSKIATELPNKVFLLDELVENSVVVCQQQFPRIKIDFVVSMRRNTKLFGQLELAEILINNLLRNACQYSADNMVRLDINNYCLIVENAISDKEDSGLALESDLEMLDSRIKPQASDDKYGYGIGIFLAEKICQQQGLQLTITSSALFFTVQVTFHDAQDKTSLS